MPGKRTASDPREVNTSVTDTRPRQAGVQKPESAGNEAAQGVQGKAPEESAYTEGDRR